MFVFARRCLPAVLYQVVQRKNLVGVSCGDLFRNMKGDYAQTASFTARASNLRSLTNCYSKENRFPKANDSLAWRSSGVRKLQTSGEQYVTYFLENVIEKEKKIEKKSANVIKNFEVSKTDGPHVVLTRKLDNEIITVKFDVNNWLDMYPDPLEDAKSLEVMSRIVVEINKGGDKTLAIHLDWSELDQAEDELDEIQSRHTKSGYQVTILDIALLNKSQDWTEEVYTHQAGRLNTQLCHELVESLEERGIDNDFLDQVRSFSIKYEHSRFVEFLEQLQSFTDSK